MQYVQVFFLSLSVLGYPVLHILHLFLQEYKVSFFTLAALIFSFIQELNKSLLQILILITP